MKSQIFFIFLFLFLFLIFSLSTGLVTFTVSNSTVWWNDSVLLNGTANYPNGSAISDGTVSINISGTNYCTNSTQSNGNWYCLMYAPNELGSYTAAITITNSTGSTFTNSTTLVVKPKFGPSPPGKTDRVVFEAPMLIQEPSGRIRQVWTRVTVWKGR